MAEGTDWTMRTERLALRPFRPDDAEAFVRYRSDDDIARYQDWDLPFTVEAARALIADQADLAWPASGGWLQIALEHEGELAGDVGVGWSGNGRRVTIGYTLIPELHGRGLATEAVEAVVDRLLAEGVRRIDATLDPDNVASMRLLERLGFEYEGLLAGAALVRGQWLDDVLYGLTPQRREEWLARERGRPRHVELVDITAENAATYRRLRTHHSQERMVASVAGSYEDALFPDADDEGGRALPWLRGIVADGEPVGFVMVAEVTETNPEPYLWRLLIDRRHQERGIGREVIGQLVERARAAGHRRLFTSYVPGPGSPQRFYERLGFVATGDLDEGEIVAASICEPIRSTVRHRDLRTGTVGPIVNGRRRYVFATTGETVRDIAARELPGDPDGPTTLMAWNLHLSLRRQPVGVDGSLLGSDIVYVEPPLP